MDLPRCLEVTVTAPCTVLVSGLWEVREDSAGAGTGGPWAWREGEALRERVGHLLRGGRYHGAGQGIKADVSTGCCGLGTSGSTFPW